MAAKSTLLPAVRFPHSLHINKSSYALKDRFKLRHVLVTGYAAMQRNKATKPTTLGTTFLERNRGTTKEVRRRE